MLINNWPSSAPDDDDPFQGMYDVGAGVHSAPGRPDIRFECVDNGID
jgi:hypothetical protein